MASAAQSSVPGDCVNGNLLKLPNVNVYPVSHQISSQNTVYTSDRTTVQVADNFKVTYYSTYKVVSAAYNSTLSETYVLYQCGAPPPDLVDLGLPADTKLFPVPVASVAAPDTTLLYFMKELGIEDRVSYVTQYAVDPCMQFLAGTQCNRSSDTASETSYDVRFGYGIDQSDSKAVMFRATSDPGPLNRAEYVKLVATFFNKELAANTLFAKTADAYAGSKQAAAEYVAANPSASPLVAWLYYSPFYPAWGSSPASPEYIAIKFAQYRRDFTEDAGGRLQDLDSLAQRFADGVNVVATKDDALSFYNLKNGSLAVLQQALQGVDVVIDETYSYDPSAATWTWSLSKYGLDTLDSAAAAAAGLNFLTSGRVLRLDAQASSSQGTTAWYEEAVARPDLVLRDLVRFFLPAAAISSPDSGATPLVRALQPPAGSGLASSTPGLYLAQTLYTSSSCPVAQQRCSGVPKAICPAVYLDCNGNLQTATADRPCAPDCTKPPVTTPPGGNGGAADRTALSSLLLLAALVCAAVLGPLLASL